MKEMLSPEKELTWEKVKEILESVAEKLYDEKLDYHNFQHALKAITAGEMFIERCKEIKVEINEKVVYYALLFHDAGYIEDCNEKGFASKEKYSAFLAGEALSKLGVGNDIIKQVKVAIIGTEFDEVPETNEAKIVRAADLFEMSIDYESFLKNNKNLKKEAELMSGNNITDNQWMIGTRNIIGEYLKQEIKIENEDTGEGVNLFSNEKVGNNLQRFLKEDF